MDRSNCECGGSVEGNESMCWGCAAELSDKQTRTFSISFVAEYFTISMNHDGIEADDAVQKAAEFLKDHYGIDTDTIVQDFEVEILDV